MNNRERVKAILNYQPCDRVPVVHFGFWSETVELWTSKGLAKEGETHLELARRLGFDFDWTEGCSSADTSLRPCFERKVVKEFPDGSKHVQGSDGVTLLQMPDAGSIPAEISHLLKDRASWEEHYLPRLQYCPERVDKAAFEDLAKSQASIADHPVSLFLGSAIGGIRNWLGVEGLSMLMVDDPELYEEIVNHCGDLMYRCAEDAFSHGIEFDYAHFWEDICFKNGPLVVPSLFDALCGPVYKKLTSLALRHGVKFVSLDCDGKIDALIPTWLENGVNVMFPIEVGTWEASVAPWRAKYGKAILGVGGMDKKVFALDRAAIDAEIERLKPLVDLGGFIPCPDHRIPPDAKFDNVAYYCEKFRKTF